MAGPVPKRSTERLGHRTDKADPRRVEMKEDIRPPKPDPTWHPIARYFYDSLKRSAMSQFYDVSDWATAFTLCETISRDLKPQVIAYDDRLHKVIRVKRPVKGSSLAGYARFFALLGVTEGDRRRLNVEISRYSAEKPELHAVKTLDDYRTKLSS